MTTKDELTSDQCLDLFAVSHGGFSLKQQEEIAEIALNRIKKGENWRDIVVDFHRSRNWGFKKGTVAEVKVSTETIKRRQIARFAWAAFQSTLILKVIILFFGLKYAMDPRPEYAWGLGISVFISFGSLVRFAWKHRNTEEADGV